MFRFSAADMDVPELGRICEDKTIQAAIYKAMEQRGHVVTEYFGFSVDSLQLSAAGASGAGAADAAQVTIAPTAAGGEKKTLRTKYDTTLLLLLLFLFLLLLPLLSLLLLLMMLLLL